MQKKPYFFLVVSITLMILFSCETVRIVANHPQGQDKEYQNNDTAQPEVNPVYHRIQVDKTKDRQEPDMPVPEVADPVWFQVLIGTNDESGMAVERSLCVPLVDFQERRTERSPGIPLLPEKKAAGNEEQSVEQLQKNYPLIIREPELPVAIQDLAEIKKDLEEVKKEIKTVKEKQTMIRSENSNAKPEKPAPVKAVQPDIIVKKEEKAPEKAQEAETMHEILARPGDEIEIRLNKNGWIFPGFQQTGDIHGLSFLSRETGSSETRFLFQARQTGEYLIPFILQDNYTGTAGEIQYLVRVVDEDSFSALLNNSPPENQEVDLAAAEDLYKQGKYVQALSEYLKYYENKPGFLNHRIAVIYELLGDYEAAARYWQRNRDAQTPFGNQAAAGLVRIAVKEDDLDTIMANLDRFSGSTDPGGGQDVIEVAEYLAGQQKPGISIRLLDNYLLQSPENKYLDDIYFLLAGIYEQDSPFRDLKKSREYYTRVYTEFPGSEHADASVERERYLNRHFFNFW